MTKRVLTFCTFFVCCGCLALLSASFATQKWIVAKPVKVGLSPSISNVTAEDNTKFRGELNFGLFEGSKTLNHGFGDRKSHIWGKYKIYYINFTKKYILFYLEEKRMFENACE